MGLASLQLGSNLSIDSKWCLHKDNETVKKACLTCWLVSNQLINLFCENVQKLNPIKPGVFWIVKNPGGGAKRHPLEINKGAPWDLMLLKAILKPIKVMITCKKLAPYLKISMRYWHLKIWRQWDFVIPWPTKIAVTHSIFEIEGSSFGFSHLFVCSTNAILQVRLYDQFLKKTFF